jgi:hypothetical protein
MAFFSDQVDELFNTHILNPEKWKILEAYAARYIRESILMKRPYDPERPAIGCIRRLAETLPKEEYPSFHVLLGLWMDAPPKKRWYWPWSKKL